MNLKCLLVVALVFGCAMYCLPHFGWYPVVGASMQPLLPMIGGVCRVDPSLSPRPGDIIVFRLPDRHYPMVKRAWAIAQGGHIWTIADNKGVTGEDSDHYGWVDPEAVVGTVTDVYSLKRFVRSATIEGRFRNWLEMHAGPARSHWSPDGNYVAIKCLRSVLLYHKDGRKIGLRRGSFSCWQNDSRVAVIWHHDHADGWYREGMYADAPDFTPQAFPPRGRAVEIPGYEAIRHMEFMDAPGGESRRVEVEGLTWCRVTGPEAVFVKCNGQEFAVPPGKLVLMEDSFTIRVPQTPGFDFTCSEAHDGPLSVDVYVPAGTVSKTGSVRRDGAGNIPGEPRT